MSVSPPLERCTCPGTIEEGKKAFWCERHKCWKTARYHKLCLTDQAYFEAWEKGRGPGQRAPGVEKELPSLATQAWNLASALGAFVLRPGLVDQEVYRQRLAACDACPERAGQRCSKCGCYVALKARGKAWGCPVGKWLAIEKGKPCGGCGR